MSRSKRVRFWGAWAIRDARSRWMQVLSIALLLALGVGMYSGMSSMSAWRTDSATASFAALRMHDLRLSLPDGSFVREGALTSALENSSSRGDVGAADERLVVPTQVDASVGGRSIIVPGRLVGAPVPTGVDTLNVSEGRRLRSSDSGRPVAELEQNFADHYELPAAGTIRLPGGRNLRYVGHAQAPEYFVVITPGADFGAEANFAVLFTPLRSAQRLSGAEGLVNELVLRLRPGANVAQVEASLSQAMRRLLPETGFTLTRGDREPAWRLLFKDAEGDQKMMDVFAYLLLGAAVFAAFNLVSRTIEAQRREIGIGMALGVEPGALSLRPFLLGAQIGLLGVALGIPAGFAATAWLRTVIETFFPLPVFNTPFQYGFFLRAAALGMLLPVLATALPVRRALRVSPVEAIQVGARAAKSSGLAWLLKGLRVPGGSLANLPIRNVLRTPRRTTMTLLGIGAVVAIVIALSGMIDSFDRTLAAGRDEVLAGAPGRLTVDLRSPQAADGPLVRRVSGAPSVASAQRSLRLASTLRSVGGSLDATVEVVDSSGRPWRPAFIDGGLPPRAPGVALADQAAEDLQLSVGDEVAIRHPVPSGPGSFRLVWTRLPVTGINASPFRFVAYANPAAAPALGVEGLVNRVSVTPRGGRSAAAVKRDLLGLPNIAAVQGAAAATDAVDEVMDQFTDVLIVSVGIAVVMALLIAFNSSAINADERTRENATMFAYGLPVAHVLRGAMVESFVAGVLGTAVGIAIGWTVLSWLIETTVSETLPDVGVLLTVAPGTYAVAVIAGTLAVTLAPLLTARRLIRTDIPSALRVVE
jgi:putative ABC transport system permease protein